MTPVKIGLLLGCIIIKGKQALFSRSSYKAEYFNYYFKGLIRGLQQKGN